MSFAKAFFVVAVAFFLFFFQGGVQTDDRYTANQKNEACDVGSVTGSLESHLKPAPHT